MRNLRKKNKKTIEQTAEEMDVSRQTIQNWESGKSKPDSVSLAKFLQTYDPSLEEFQQLLTGNNAKKDKPSHGEILFQHSKEAADNYFNTTGFKIINIESFVESIITPSNFKQYELVDNEDSVLIPLLVYCNYSKEIKNQIDFDYIMATLAIRLKHKGYIVNEITEDGGLRLFIPNEELREHLGSIILEHLLIPESRLKDLPFNEQRCFKGTQEKYDRIRDELSAIKSDEVNPFINENGLSSILGPKEIKKYNLLLGVDQGEDEDGSMEIWCPESDRIYAADSLEELSDFMSSHMEMLKNSVNDDISIVVTENYCTEATFTVTGEANYIEGMRVYEKHSTIYLDSLYHTGIYKVFAVVNLVKGEWDPSTASFASDADFLAFIRQAQARSLYDTGVEVTAADRILTLITCDRSYAAADGRLIVLAVEQ